MWPFTKKTVNIPQVFVNRANPRNNLSQSFEFQNYLKNNPNIERVIFTDPNIPTIMMPVNGKNVKGGDIDDLFMILDAIYNTQNTVFVIGGEKGSSEIRHESFMNALNSIPLSNLNEPIKKITTYLFHYKFSYKINKLLKI